MKFDEFFTAENRFLFIEEVRAGEEPWSVLSRIGPIIEGFIGGRKGSPLEDFAGRITAHRSPTPGGEGEDRSLMIGKTFLTPSEILDVEMGIYVGAGTFLEAGSMIKGPCFIGERCEIRHGAYIRGGVIVGEGCVIGHATEVKNSIIMDRSNAGHFNYLGDSVLGSCVNLGAGTVLANLRFRSRLEILSGKILQIAATGHMGKTINTGRSKLGAVVGDFTEIGCNSVISPGALIGSDCWIYPNTTAPKGLYPPSSVIRARGAQDVITRKRKV
jgi:carbonic anhydrase/acetyltransferase-like protein (isoleucine patch superfamily)